MAQVSMDLSELKAMEKNATLLEEALKREQEQSKQISILEKEKIDALKANEKSVTIISRVETTEHLLLKRSPSDVYNKMDQLMESMSGRDRQRADRHMFETGRRGYSSSDFQWELEHRGGMASHSCMEHEIKQIQHCFFNVTKSTSKSDDQVSVKGLKEVTDDLRVQIQKEIDSDIKYKLERLAALEIELGSAKEQLGINKYDLETAERKLAKITDRLEDMNELNIKLEEDVVDLKEKLSKMNVPFNYFNAYFKLKKLQVK